MCWFLRSGSAFAEESGIEELKKTTRDEPDYNKLMAWRLDVLRKNGLGIKEIQETISKIGPASRSERISRYSQV